MKAKGNLGRPVLRAVQVITQMLSAYFLLGGAVAQAAFFPVGAFAPGDGLATRDTVGGLDWLDLSLTSGLDYQAVVAGAGGYTTSGWRVATNYEACSLTSRAWLGTDSASSACPVANSLGAGFNTKPEAVTAAVALVDALTPTLTGFVTSNGVPTNQPFQIARAYFSSHGEEPGLAFLGIYADAPGEPWNRIGFGAISVNPNPAPGAGTFLVRAIPEPTTATFLLFGLMLSARKRRRQR